MFLFLRGFRVVSLLCALSLAAGIEADEAVGSDAVLGDLARGEALFDLCSQCHGADGAGNPDIEAPSIAGLPGWYVDATLRKFKAGGRGTHPDDISGMRMRPMSMWLRNDEDIIHVTAYVATLPPKQPAPLLEGGDARAGEREDLEVLEARDRAHRLERVRLQPQLA